MGLAWLPLLALPLAGALSVGQLPDGLEQDYVRALLEDHDDPDYSRTLAEVEGLPDYSPDWMPKVDCRPDGRPDKWTMPSFKDVKDETPLAPPWVIIRGGTFRSGVRAQEESFCSVRKHVIQPLMAAHALSSVHVHLCVRPHEDNARILNHAEKLFGVRGGDVSLREVSKEQKPTQQGQYLSCLADVPSDARFALVMRPDLVFMKSLTFTGPLSPDRFYFQWNLFQMCTNKEMADQIHVVGANLMDQLKKAIDTAITSNTSMWFQQPKHPHSLRIGYHDDFHLMYNFVKGQFGAERLGYLNHYPTENCYNREGEPTWHKHGFCRQRGNGEAAFLKDNTNPDVNTNPLFVYDRHVAAKSLSTCDGDDVNIRKLWMDA